MNMRGRFTGHCNVKGTYVYEGELVDFTYMWEKTDDLKDHRLVMLLPSMRLLIFDGDGTYVVYDK